VTAISRLLTISAVVISVSAGSLAAVIFPAAANETMTVPQGSEDSLAPFGLTAELDSVPGLVQQALPKPYQLDWQKRLMEFQIAFEAAQGHPEAVPGVDPITTGSISDQR